MEEATQDDFSIVCPKCRGPRIRPVAQQNNFDDAPPGQVALGDAHVTTSRDYQCDDCSHRWEETVPHPR